MSTDADLAEDRRRKYEADLWYDVWRAGGNPDRVCDDFVDDCYYRGCSADEATGIHLRRERKRREELRAQREQEEWEMEERAREALAPQEGACAHCGSPSPLHNFGCPAKALAPQAGT